MFPSAARTPATVGLGRLPALTFLTLSSLGFAENRGLAGCYLLWSREVLESRFVHKGLLEVTHTLLL